jgi:Helix-turn-helix domain
MGAEGQRGLTPRELAGILRVSPDKVLGWIRAGELPALNTSSARCRKPRYVVLPHHLVEFERRRQAGPAPKASRRPRKSATVDYYPD